MINPEYFVRPTDQSKDRSDSGARSNTSRDNLPANGTSSDGRFGRNQAETRRDQVWLSQASSHPSWVALIKYCVQMGCGEIEVLKIQDGLPVSAKAVTRKMRFPA